MSINVPNLRLNAFRLQSLPCSRPPSLLSLQSMHGMWKSRNADTSYCLALQEFAKGRPCDRRRSNNINKSYLRSMRIGCLNSKLFLLWCSNCAANVLLDCTYLHSPRGIHAEFFSNGDTCAFPNFQKHAKTTSLCNSEVCPASCHMGVSKQN